MPRNLGLSVGYDRNKDIAAIREYMKDLVDNNQLPYLQSEFAVLTPTSYTVEYEGKWNNVQVSNFSSAEYVRVTVEINDGTGNQAIVIGPQEFVNMKFPNTFISKVTVDVVALPGASTSADLLTPTAPAADTVVQVALSNT